MENTPAFVLLWFSCRNGAGSSADVTLAPLIPLINANVIKIVHQRIYFVRKHLCVCVCKLYNYVERWQMYIVQFQWKKYDF